MVLELGHTGNLIMATVEWGRDGVTEGELQEVGDHYSEENRLVLTEGAEWSLLHVTHIEHYYPRYSPHTPERG